MVEKDAEKNVKAEAEKTLIATYLGTKNVLEDPKYKETAVLKETEAHRRAELVSDVEYNYQIALKKGDYFLG